MTKLKNAIHVPAACILVAGLAVGCPSTEETAAQRQDAKTEAARDARDAAFEQRIEFMAQMEEELVAVETELDSLAATVKSNNEAKAEAKTEAEAELSAAREKCATTRKELELGESATESTWDDVQSSFKTSYDDLKDSVDKARQTVSDKIEPS